MDRRNSNFFLARLGFESQLGSSVILRNGNNEVGRNNDADIRVDSKYCSREHCCITVVDDRVTLCDKNKSNGTFINGIICQNAEVILKVNDEIGIGIDAHSSVLLNNKELFMYKLKSSSNPQETIDLSSHDDEPVRSTLKDLKSIVSTSNGTKSTLDRKIPSAIFTKANTNVVTAVTGERVTSITNGIMITSNGKMEPSNCMTTTSKNISSTGIPTGSKNISSASTDIPTTSKSISTTSNHITAVNGNALHNKDNIDEPICLSSDDDTDAESDDNCSDKSDGGIYVDENLVLSQKIKQEQKEEMAQMDDAYDMSQLPFELDLNLNLHEMPDLVQEPETPHIDQLPVPLQDIKVKPIVTVNRFWNEGDAPIEIDTDKEEQNACDLPVPLDQIKQEKLLQIKPFWKEGDDPIEIDFENDTDQNWRVKLSSKDINFEKYRQKKRSVIIIDAKPMPKRRQSVYDREPIIKRRNSCIEKESHKHKKPDADTLDERKAKLKQIEQNKKIEAEANKTNAIPERTITKPKVKVTINNRGHFLVNAAEMPPRPVDVKRRRLSIDVSVPTSVAKHTEMDVDTPKELEDEINKNLNERSSFPEERARITNRHVGAFKESPRDLSKVLTKQQSNDGSSAVVLTPTALNIVREFSEQLNAHSKRRISRVRPSIEEHSNDSIAELRPLDEPGPSWASSRIGAPVPAEESNNLLMPSHYFPQLSDYRIIMKKVSTNSILAQTIKHKPKQMVSFNDKSEIRVFESDENDITERRKLMNDIMGQLGGEVRDCFDERKIFQKDPCHDIISAIVSWRPDWLDDDDPPLNGVDHILKPLVHNYSSFECFASIMIPIMKIEMWKTITNDYQSSKSEQNINVTLNYSAIEKRGNGTRCVYHCEVDSAFHAKLSDMELVVLAIGNGEHLKTFFGLIFNVRRTAGNNRFGSRTFFVMEANVSSDNSLIPAGATNVTIKKITNLKMDLRLFNAVLELRGSSLLNNVLNPLLNKKIVIHPRNARYAGPDKLNAEQMNVLQQVYHKCALTSEPNITLIDGPPGTGKSILIVNLLMQFLYGAEAMAISNRRQILVCAHSNQAVDLLAKKLLHIRHKMKDSRSKIFDVVRFGPLEKIDKDVRKISVQHLSKANQRGAEPIADLEKERTMLTLKMKAIQLDPKGKQVNHVNEIKAIKCRLEKLNITLSRINTSTDDNTQSTDFNYYLKNANIICTTLCSILSMMRYMNPVDICIVDEATQCTEPTTLIPLQLGVSTLILVGDVQQLPGTVLSSTAKKHGYTTSLFARINSTFQNHKLNPVFRLLEQYRMHPEICRWPNKYFYEDRLRTAPTTTDATFPLKPYSILSLNFNQSKQKHDEQFKIFNLSEADFIERMLGVMGKYINNHKYSIAVITPYEIQRIKLAERLRLLPFKDLSVNTIDSCQGQERDIIIMSCARTDGIGFLENPQRLNVALTRARKCLIVCGNFRSLRKTHVWKALLEDGKERKCLHEIARNKYKDDDAFDSFVRSLLWIEQKTSQSIIL